EGLSISYLLLKYLPISDLINENSVSGVTIIISLPNKLLGLATNGEYPSLLGDEKSFSIINKTVLTLLSNESSSRLLCTKIYLKSSGLIITLRLFPFSL